MCWWIKYQIFQFSRKKIKKSFKLIKRQIDLRVIENIEKDFKVMFKGNLDFCLFKRENPFNIIDILIIYKNKIQDTIFFWNTGM